MKASKFTDAQKAFVINQTRPILQKIKPREVPNVLTTDNTDFRSRCYLLLRQTKKGSRIAADG